VIRFRGLLFLSFILAGVFLPAQLHAQKELEKSYRGDWAEVPPVKPKFEGDLTPQECAEATAWLNGVVEILHKMPLLEDPQGFRVIPHVSAQPQDIDDGSASGRPTHIAGLVQLNLASFENTDGGIVSNANDSAAQIQVVVNDLVPIFGAASIQTGSEESGDFYYGMPHSDGTIHDLPVYNRWVVIQNGDTPLFAQVTRGDYLKFAIRAAEKALADMQKRVAANVQESTDEQNRAALDLAKNHVVELKQQQDEMSSDEAQMPATLATTDENGAVRFASPDDASATPVVTINPALFDSSGSRAAPRILAIKFDTDDADWPDILETIDAQLDWQSLEALVQ